MAPLDSLNGREDSTSLEDTLGSQEGSSFVSVSNDISRHSAVDLEIDAAVESPAPDSGNGINYGTPSNLSNNIDTAKQSNGELSNDYETAGDVSSKAVVSSEQDSLVGTKKPDVYLPAQSHAQGISTVSQPSATLVKAIAEIRRLAGINGISISLEILPALLRKEFTLLTLPRELRDQILSLLLINPDLGRISGVDNDSHGGYGTNLQYGLDPTILRVCKQLCTEGEKLLYGQKIYIGCVGGYGRMCPLTRYLDPCSQREPLQKVPAALKVCHWLAVVNSDGGGVNVPSWQFKDFCRTIALSTPRLVEVALLQKGILGDIDADYPEASETLSPLNAQERRDRLCQDPRCNRI